MKLLVTGGTGFVGQHVLRLLAQEDLEIHLAVKPDETAAATEALAKRFPNRIHTVALDLLDPTSVRRCLTELRLTHLLHLAWYAEPGKFWASPLNNSFESASQALVTEFYNGGGKKAVIAGTSAEYDWKSGGRLMARTSALSPATLYGQAKLNLFRALDEQTKQNPGSLAWGRIFWLYGEGEVLNRLVSSAFHSLIQGRPFQTTHGQQRRDFLHVEDVARAFVTALKTDLSGAFNVSSGHPVQVKDLLAEIGRLTGRMDLIQFGAVPLKADEPAELFGDIQELTACGYSPQIDLNLGLQRTYSWWKTQS